MNDSQESAAPHHAEMQCAVTGIGYDFRNRRAVIYMPPENCTDMEGCIRAILRIDPQCQQIVTVSDGIPDTSYLRGAAGEWRAIPAPAPFVWRPTPLFEKSC